MANTSNLPANFAWYIERERVGILEWKKGEGVECATSPTALGNGLTASFLLSRKAPDFTADLSENSQLPPEFHEALAFKVIAMGYLSAQNLNPQLAQTFEMMYEKKVKDAKKYARSNHTSHGYIQPVDF
jgi:hypothetical protein